jgi:hypothetical protein
MHGNREVLHGKSFSCRDELLLINNLAKYYPK